MWDRTLTQTVVRQGLRTAALALAGVALAAPAAAQLDPLLPYKRVPPNVIVIVDTSFRMLDDGLGNYYDPKVYTVAGDPVATALGVSPAATYYRRVYRGLRFETAQDSTQKYEADTVTAVPSTPPQPFAADRFFAETRYWIALKGVRQAVSENPSGVRWGLMKLPQSTPAWRTGTNCDKPVEVGAPTGVTDNVACSGVGANRFGIFAPDVAAANSTAAASTAVSVSTNSATSATLLTRLDPTGIGATAPLIPAGRDTATVEDRPLLATLTEAKAEVARAVANDATCRACRNTIVVLVVGGRDAANDALTRAKAAEFFSITASGTARRVPIYVVAIKVPDQARSQLQAIADNSGGRYFEASSIVDVTRAMNLAVQAGYSSWNDFTNGRGTEHLPVSAVVGTVNLKDARDRAGASLENTDIESTAGAAIPQRSNLLLTGGFAIGGPSSGGSSSPGFEGRLRAFRSQKPVADASKPGGWKFVQDGTPLWPTLDGRPATAGMARTPADADRRNIYTWIPGTGVVAFSLANAAAIGPYLGGADPASLIPFVRSQPLGAVINSTPAIMDPPSLDPPPDADYGRTDAPDSYAGDHKLRRSIIWVGMNDGMMHAIDARTGYEVWAFVPHNLLPRLRALLDGQPVEQFTYFVDSSPKIAEVKVSGEWKTLMIFGQGWGGTFYQAFEVTEAGMGVAPDSDDWGAVLATFANTTRVRYLWSFPEYSNFDTTYDSGTLTLTDGTPGGGIRFFGDLRAAATAVEKSVGFTWSDPAVGPLDADRTLNVVVAGSGYFPPVEDVLPGRGAAAPRAGRTIFALDARTGRPLGNPGSCPTTSSRGCYDLGDLNNPSRKNTVQADPTAAANLNSSVVNRFYVGDTDGRYYRFNIDNTGLMSRAWVFSTTGSQPVYSSSALLQIGTTEQYIFFSTGSDLLAPTPATAGGVGPLRLFGLRDNVTSTTTQLTYALGWSSCSTRAGVTTCTGGDERPSTSPSVAGDIVFFTTSSEPAAAPCTDFSAKLYAFTYKGTAAYDTDGSGAITKFESPLVKTLAGRASAPFIVDQHLYFTTSGNQTGANVEVFGDPEDFNNGVGQVGVRILSWREVR